MLQFTMDDPAVHTHAFICQSSPLSHCVVAPLTRDARKELRPQVYQLLLQLTEVPSPQPWFCGLEEPRKGFLKKSKYFLEVSLSPVSGGEANSDSNDDLDLTGLKRCQLNTTRRTTDS